MIKRLKYVHGMGDQPGNEYPRDILVAVSVGPSRISPAILRSFEAEKIDELSGQYGHREAGEPVELDRLTVETEKYTVSVTVYNRGIAMLLTKSDEIRRLHRFFGVIERELARV